MRGGLPWPRLPQPREAPPRPAASVPHLGGRPGCRQEPEGPLQLLGPTHGVGYEPFQTPRPCCPAVGPWPSSPAPLLTTLVFSLGWPHPPRPGSRPPLPGGPPCCFPACLWVISLCPWLAPVLPATAGLLISLLPGGGSRMAKRGGPGPWRLRPALQGPRRKPLLWPVTWAWQGVPLGAAGLSRACP